MGAPDSKLVIYESLSGERAGTPFRGLLFTQVHAGSPLFVPCSSLAWGRVYVAVTFLLPGKYINITFLPTMVAQGVCTRAVCRLAHSTLANTPANPLASATGCGGGRGAGARAAEAGAEPTMRFPTCQHPGRLSLPLPQDVAEGEVLARVPLRLAMTDRALSNLARSQADPLSLCHRMWPRARCWRACR